jgi:hypothetical protein
MSSSKKIYLERDFAAGVYLSEAQNPVPPPLYTLYACILVMSTIPKRKYKRSDIEANYRNETKTF